ncbi:expressed unknown protein [Seminavis robusta]|uniref:Transmembrane protein n=1 Tax=Seminavis robusta TaxID=568900 RepID=A0A9N8EGF4_9STRA|nr:expressed unknown protein [Seminavis robusta]|eukprot:Sro1088_g239980.1 n/a (433) ;mRNA; r:16110-17408
MGKPPKRGSSLPLHIESCSTASSSEAERYYHHQYRPPRGSTLKDRVKSIRQEDRQAVVEDNAIAAALAARAFHLPGYSYMADWSQYIVNNHLIFGLCCRHPKHPLTTKLRFLNLMASALFGLAITNMIWLGYIYYDEDPDSVLFKISFYDEDAGNELIISSNLTNDDQWFFNNNTTNSSMMDDLWDNYNVTNTMAPTTLEPKSGWELFLPRPKNAHTETLGNTLQITRGMVLLWTLGAALHAVFDNTIWRLSACGCCLPGNRCERFGFLRGMSGAFTIFVVVMVTAVATFAVVLRATLMSHDEIEFSASNSGGLVDDAIDVRESFREAAQNIGALEFVMGYFVEFFLALFVYHPLFMTILFMGCLNFLGCGKLRVLGGRPFEMRQLEEEESGSQRHSAGLVTGNQCLSVPKGAVRRLSHTERSSYSSVNNFR